MGGQEVATRGTFCWALVSVASLKFSLPQLNIYFSMFVHILVSNLKSSPSQINIYFSILVHITGIKFEI